jgi:hypothetical protein
MATRRTGRRLPSAPESVRAPLTTWAYSGFAVVVLSLAGARLLGGARPDQVPEFGTLWRRWDVQLFEKVARDGYLSPGDPTHTEVDFPGFPLLLRLVHLVVPDWTAAGLLIAYATGAVSCVALWRLSAAETGPSGGTRSVRYLLTFPYAVFLFAGYSEGLFLAATVTSWLAARRGRWPLAAVLAAAATATRLIGIAFALALAVEYVGTRRRTGARGRAVFDRNAPWLALPALPVLAYFAYLHARTGHWDQYAVAMRAGWGRRTAWPWNGLEATWHQALNLDQSDQFLWFWRVELAAVALGVGLTVALVRSRRWGEASYLAGTTLIISASSYWASGARAVLVAFPLYLGLARLTARRPGWHAAILAVSAPLMAVFVLTFTSGGWVD